MSGENHREMTVDELPAKFFHQAPEFLKEAVYEDQKHWHHLLQ